MSRNNSIKIIISLLTLIVLGCTMSRAPAVVIPTQTEARQTAITPKMATQTPAAMLPTQTKAGQATITPLKATQNSICGWIENSSSTGAMAPKMTVSGTGQVLQLWNLDVEAIGKFNYVSPAYFRVQDPVYQAPDLLVNFSSIQQVSSCPLAQSATINPTQAVYVSGFAGTWDTNWGDMTCSVDGQMVKCNYTHDIGIIEAWLSPDGITMEGTWSESPSYQPPADGGRVTFTLSADGNGINGHWWYGQNEDGGAWTGTRK
jgi:hypothetical protein